MGRIIKELKLWSLSMAVLGSGLVFAPDTAQAQSFQHHRYGQEIAIDNAGNLLISAPNTSDFRPGFSGEAYHVAPNGTTEIMSYRLGLTPPTTGTHNIQQQVTLDSSGSGAIYVNSSIIPFSSNLDPDPAFGRSNLRYMQRSGDEIAVCEGSSIGTFRVYRRQGDTSWSQVPEAALTGTLCSIQHRTISFTGDLLARLNRTTSSAEPENCSSNSCSFVRVYERSGDGWTEVNGSPFLYSTSTSVVYGALAGDGNRFVFGGSGSSPAVRIVEERDGVWMMEQIENFQSVLTFPHNNYNTHGQLGFDVAFDGSWIAATNWRGFVYMFADPADTDSVGWSLRRIYNPFSNAGISSSVGEYRLVMNANKIASSYYQEIHKETSETGAGRVFIFDRVE